MGCRSTLGLLCHLSHPCVKTSGKSFLQNEAGYKDGLELQKGKKQGVVTQ